MGSSFGAERVGAEVDRRRGGRTAVIGASVERCSSWRFDSTCRVDPAPRPRGGGPGGRVGAAGPAPGAEVGAMAPIGRVCGMSEGTIVWGGRGTEPAAVERFYS